MTGRCVFCREHKRIAHYTRLGDRVCADCDPCKKKETEMASGSEMFFEMVREDHAVSDPVLIAVTLDYRIDDNQVQYTRKLTNDQLAELIIQFDELADDNDE